MRAASATAMKSSARGRSALGAQLRRIHIGVRVGALLAVLAARTADASGVADYGAELLPGDPAGVRLTGYLRARGEGLINLDLDRGATPSGRTFYPEPLANSQSALLTTHDARLRTDIVAQGPGGGVGVVARIDWIDNLVLGGNPQVSPGFGASPTPAASPGQLPSTLVKLRFAYGVAALPVGVLAVGRMGAHWGLGMLANGGDCADCDGGDAADRIAFVTPLFGHYVALAADVSASGPFTPRKDQRRFVDLDPTDDVRTFTAAIFQMRDRTAIARRAKAGKWTFDYGGTVSHRRQDNDVPASYLSIATPVPFDDGQVMRRGYQATLVDGWARLLTPSLRLELEGAFSTARVEQASLIPGVLFNDPVTATQWGLAFESDYGSDDAFIHAGLNAGAASGDRAPGFGAFPANIPATAGELDAPQAFPPDDLTANNFRFNPDYRVDRILFRELIGTVTDAVYAKPWVSLRPINSTAGILSLNLAVIASMAMMASSTPSGAAPLGVEADSALEWKSRDGLLLAFDHAVLFPLEGLDNPAASLKAQVAQSFRFRVLYAF